MTSGRWREAVWEVWALILVLGAPHPHQLGLLGLQKQRTTNQAA